MRPRLPAAILVPLLAFLTIEAVAFVAWAIGLSPTHDATPPAHPDMNWGDSLSQSFDRLIPAMRIALGTWGAVTLISGLGVWRGWQWAWYVAFALQLPLLAVLGVLAVAVMAASDRQLPIVAFSLLILAVPMGIVVLLFQKRTLELLGVRVL